MQTYGKWLGVGAPSGDCLAVTNIFTHALCTVCTLERQKEPQKSVIRGRCRSSVTLVVRNTASDVAEIRRQSRGYQYQSQWIHPDMSLEHPDTQNQPRTAARMTDGKIMYILWLIIIFILQLTTNIMLWKYRKSPSPSIFSQKLPAFEAII